jgi:hypothetical protein
MHGYTLNKADVVMLVMLLRGNCCCSMIRTGIVPLEIEHHHHIPKCTSPNLVCIQYEGSNFKIKNGGIRFNTYREFKVWIYNTFNLPGLMCSYTLQAKQPFPSMWQTVSSPLHAFNTPTQVIMKQTDNCRKYKFTLLYATKKKTDSNSTNCIAAAFFRCMAKHRYHVIANNSPREDESTDDETVPLRSNMMRDKKHIS